MLAPDFQNPGLADGHNPIKKAVLRGGVLGSLWLTAGLAAAALSWYTSPECVTNPPGCGDRASYCNVSSVFSPTKDCHILAKPCMETCGCCSDTPEAWCPNKVQTLQSIIADNSQALSIFSGVFMFYYVIIYWRFCCSTPTAAKRKTAAIISMTTACVLLIIACFWVTYELTDCQNKFRGISDVSFMVSACCCVRALVAILMAVASLPSIAQYDSLLANIAEQRRCGDPNILVLDVSADRARRFLADEQQLGTGLSVQTSRSCCLQGLRGFFWLRMFILLMIVAYAAFVTGGDFYPSPDFLKLLIATRRGCFAIVYFLIFAVLGIYARIRRSKTYLDHQKHRDDQQWLQELQGPQQLLLFHNASTASQGQPESMAGKSVISLGTRRAFFFEPEAQVADAPGAFTKTTHTRILPTAEGQTDVVLEFKTVVHRQSPSLLRDEVRAEAVARIPLEPHHEAQVRAWLQERRATFEFETAPEIDSAISMQLIQPEP